MTNLNWTSEDIPNQSNKVIVITGATSGLGKQATKVLVSKNAKVILAVRNTQKAKDVVLEIRKDFPNAKLEIRHLDLGKLKSVKTFAKEFTNDYSQLDVLINNAGIMMCPYSKTEDGFEIQMGTNHFGHFALTGLLTPLLLETKDSRVVATSSIAHKSGSINFDDINWESRKYNTIKAYADSKLANLYFTYELARKYKDNPNAPIFTVAHPGGTNTDLGRHMSITKLLAPLLGQKVEVGTLPSLRAATDLNAVSGDYFGPKNFFESRGYPVIVQPNKMAQNEVNAKRLWEISEQLTGVKY
jgi:NAD(P)-dependent dehydrogenase (short-subunit alcohol dehydrogenase family)